MTAADPGHPLTTADEYLQAVSSGGSAPTTVGEASVVKAIAGGFAGRPPGPSLASQLAAWQARRAAAPQSDILKAIAEDPALTEHVAKSIAKREHDDHLKRTSDRTAAQHSAFVRYRAAGGKKAFSTFKAGLGL